VFQTALASESSLPRRRRPFGAFPSLAAVPRHRGPSLLAVASCRSRCREPPGRSTSRCSSTSESVASDRRCRPSPARCSLGLGPLHGGDLGGSELQAAGPTATPDGVAATWSGASTGPRTLPLRAAPTACAVGARVLKRSSHPDSSTAASEEAVTGCCRPEGREPELSAVAEPKHLDLTGPNRRSAKASFRRRPCVPRARDPWGPLGRDDLWAETYLSSPRWRAGGIVVSRPASWSKPKAR
jgi:hypothetical protein